MNFLKKVETTHPVEEVVCLGKQVWPILRILYFFNYRNKLHQPDKKMSVDDWRLKLAKLTQVFTGFLNWFTLRRFWCFSDSSENKVINGCLQNKLFFEIFNQLGAKNITYFEKPCLKHDKKSKNPNMVSTSMIDLLAMILSKFIKVGEVRGSHILKDIKKEWEIALEDEKLIKLYLGYSRIFYLLLKIKKPRAVFVSDYYNICHMALIGQCKEHLVPTIELQHGVANEEHPAYNFYKKNLSRFICPDYLFSFGSMVEDELSEFSYIPLRNIKALGHPYIEYVRGDFVKREKDKIEKVGVTLQWTDEDVVIDFIIKAARHTPSITYLLIPRDPTANKYKSFKLPENVCFERNRNFYEMMKDVDLHCTTYSTCALEAPSFGVPNVLLDFDQMATKYFSKVLSNPKVSLYVEEIQDFVDIVLSKPFAESHEILQAGDKIIQRGYKSSLQLELENLKILKP